MPNQEDREAHYVRKVQEETRKYIETLLKENETLRGRLAKLENDKLSLEGELDSARQELGRKLAEQIRLKSQLTDIEAENERSTTEYHMVERQNANLANLYVASYRLHGTLNRGEVLSVILEILVNLVGSEEIGIFRLSEKSTALELVSSFGIDEEKHKSLPLSGAIGRVVDSGEVFIGGPEDGVIASVPMKVDGKVTGVIAIFSLLPQKTALEEVDHELFQLLTTHASVALYCTELHDSLSRPIGTRS